MQILDTKHLKLIFLCVCVCCECPLYNHLNANNTKWNCCKRCHIMWHPNVPDRCWLKWVSRNRIFFVNCKCHRARNMYRLAPDMFTVIRMSIQINRSVLLTNCWTRFGSDTSNWSIKIVVTAKWPYYFAVLRVSLFNFISCSRTFPL